MSVMGECVTEVIGAPSRLRLIRKAAALARIFPHFFQVDINNSIPCTMGVFIYSIIKKGEGQREEKMSH